VVLFVSLETQQLHGSYGEENEESSSIATPAMFRQLYPEANGAQDDEDCAEDLFRTVPGIAELRTTEPLLLQRLAWELDSKEKDLIEVSESGNGGTIPRGRPLIRFGSRLECRLHLAMQLLALYDLCFTTFVAGFDAVYPLRRTLLVIFVDLVLTALYALGVVTRFRTTFISVHGAVEIDDAKLIRKSVLEHRTFRMDCISLGAAPLLYARGVFSLFSCLRLLRCWRLPRDTQRMMLLCSSDTMTSTLVQVIVGTFVSTHIYACIWFQAKLASPPGYGHEWSSWNGWSKDVFDREHADEGQYSIPMTFGTPEDLY